MSGVYKGMELFRMDYHKTGEAYIVTEFDEKTKYGELVEKNNKNVKYIFNEASIGNAIYKNEKDALKDYKLWEEINAMA